MPVEWWRVEQGIDAFGFRLGQLARKGGTADRAIRTDRAVATSNLWIALSAPSALSALSASFMRHPWTRFSIEEIGKKIDQHENETQEEGDTETQSALSD